MSDHAVLPSTMTGGPEDPPGAIEQLLEAMPIGFTNVDDSLRITAVNRSAEEQWGYRREDVLGHGLWELFPDAATPEVIEAMSRLVTTGEPVQVEVFYAPLRKWIQVHAFRTRGQPGFSTFFVDVTETRVAEQEREEAEARYRDIVEEVPAITYLDDGDGHPLYVSPQCKQLIGYSPEEWLVNANLWRDALHPDDREAVVAQDAMCRRRGIPFEAEYRMLARDGRVLWFHDRSTPMLDTNGRPTLVHGVMVDITQHRRAQAAIERKDEIMAAVGFAAERLLRSPSWEDAIGDVVARLGTASGVGQVNLVELWPTREALVGTSRAEWVSPGADSIAKDLDDVPHADLLGWIARFEHGQSFAQRVGPDPASFAAVGIESFVVAPVIVGAEPWGFLLLTDVTTARVWSAAEVEAIAGAAAAVSAAMERQRTELALRQSEERFRRLAEEAPDVIFRIRLVPDLAIEYISPAVEPIFGYSVEELTTDRDLLFRLIHPEDLPTLEETLRDAGPEHLFRWIARDGRMVWTEQRSVKVFGDGGEVIAVEGIARDVSDRVTAEQTLRESFEALHRSNEERRMLLMRLVKAQEEERQRIANDIHDDSIQIMTAVGMRLGLLRGLADDPDSAKALRSAEETVALAIQRLRRLLFDLHPLSLDNSGLVAALHDHARHMGEDGPRVAIDDRLEAEPPTESRTILYRIAQEALTNVRKHARAGHVEITLGTEGQGVRLTIRDDGAGFDPDAAANDGIPGHAGLPSMRERARQAGGWCRVSSTPGQGTTVDCWIPELGGAETPDA